MAICGNTMFASSELQNLILFVFGRNIDNGKSLFLAGPLKYTEVLFFQGVVFYLFLLFCLLCCCCFFYFVDDFLCLSLPCFFVFSSGY